MNQYVFAAAFENMAQGRSPEEREMLVLKDARNCLLVALIYGAACGMAVLVWTSLA